MKKRILSLICAVTMAAAVPVYAADGSASRPISGSDGVTPLPQVVEGRVPAFPGAEGGGMYASGARGAIEDGKLMEVYHVTNLNDSGEGSFRDAVSKGNRIVVFDVSGYIDLSSNVNISKGNMTILGQTAPGDGICFRSNNIKVSGKNVILRYLRFRVGAHDANGNDTRAQDGLEITDNAENIILDHCSVSWGTDENLSSYAVKDVTIQWSIIAEALNQSVHDKGEHSYAAIWGGVNLSVHHNLIATHKSRNPKIGTSETVAMTAGYTDNQTLVDIRNNVFYNWGDKAGYGAENGAEINIINNYYKPGPATPSDKRARIFEFSAGNKYQPNWSGKVYASGNVIDDNSTDPTAVANAKAVNADNWQIAKGTGVYLSASNPTYVKLNSPNETYIDEYPITTTSAEQAYEAVLSDAGANLPKRDAVDVRILKNAANRTAPTGSKGSAGLLDDPIDGIPSSEAAKYDGRGYPIIESVSRAADYDTDRDGIPDEWEDKMGLDKSNPFDSLNITVDGYTWLETFVEEHFTKKSDAGLIVSVSSDKALAAASDEVELKAEIALNGYAQDLDRAEFYVGNESVSEVAELTPAAGAAEYIGGAVKFIPQESFPDEFAVIAAGYYQDGRLADIKLKTVRRGEVGKLQTVEVGNVSGNAVLAYLWDSINGMRPITEEKSEGAPLTYISTDGALPIGENYLTAKVYKKDGSYTLSPAKKIYVGGYDELTDGWSGSGRYDDVYECYSIYGGLSDAQTIERIESGDFTLVCEISDISNTAAGAFSGLFAESGSQRYFIGKGYENYKPIVKCGEQKLENAQNIRYLKIECADGKLTFSAAENLLNWQTVAEQSASGGAVKIGAAVESETPTMSLFGRLDMIYDKTSPNVHITNIEQNQTLGFNETLQLGVTPDNAAVQQIIVFLNDSEIASVTDADGFSGEVSIPLSFPGVASGTLKVVCIDANLCTAEETRGVVISADPTPWSVADIGGTGGALPSYVEVAEGEIYKNETFKINAIDGALGGTSDRFSYLYQQFSGDNIIYYRSRLQGSKQFGIVLKSDLSADGATYFFGGDQAGGAVSYSLRARDAAGESMRTVEDVTSKTGGAANLYFAAEKLGNTLNIYQTGAGSAVYKEKTLIASVDVSALGDEYYMGFGAVNDSANPPDTGWMEIDKIPTDDLVSYKWDFDNGIDWYWQHQEKKVLESEWSEQEMGGNASGKMMIEPDEDYSGERYIFREYLMPSDDVLVLTETFDIMLAGEEPDFDAYFKTKSGNKAFKINFAEDGSIIAGGKNIGAYEKSKWYTVSISTDMGADSDSCSITVKDANGAAVASAQSVGIGDMREQKNIVKKTAIDGAVLFEPTLGADGRYYIDNVSVIGTKSSVKVEKSVSWYTFKNVSAISGAFTVDGTTASGGSDPSGEQLKVAAGAELKTGSKTVGGVAFTNRIRLNKNKAGMLTVPVKTGATVKVYCGSANSSAERMLYINGEGNKVKENTMLEYAYSGADGNIEIYAADGIDVHGICVELVKIVQ